MKTEDKLFAIKSKKDYPSIIFIFLWLSVFTYKTKGIYTGIPSDNLKDNFFNLLFLVVSIYFLFHLLWMLWGKTIIVIENEKLIVKTILFFTKTKYYYVSQIHNVKIEHDTKSNEYWGVQGFRFYNSYNVITFDYQNRKVIIGAGLENFDLEKLKSAI